MNQPNILYLHSHDTGRYVQPYGYPIPTPNLQRLAEQGVLFRQAFSAGPTCSASRATLLTGQCPHSSGMLGLAHRGWSLADYRQHIIHTLRAVGYRSTLCGVQHVARDAAAIGYDEIVKLTSHDVRHVAAAAAEFLMTSPKEPFFLSVGFNETHRQFHEPGPGEDPRFCRPPAPLPDTPETRRDMAAFKASARVLDQGIGMALDALEESGLARRTLVVCTTDHGIAFPAMKCNLTDHGMGVLLILRGPGGWAGGKVCDALVSHLDLFPTLCDVANADHPQWLQGKSLLPLLRGQAQEINDEIFAEVTYHAAYEPMRAVRTKRWKYIRRFDGRTRAVLPNTDDGLSKSVWLAGGWRERPVDAEQLFDLLFDPNEAHNLASDAAMAGVLAEIRGRLDRWMKATADPLLLGRVPAPPGAVVNPVDGLSPNEPVQPA